MMLKCCAYRLGWFEMPKGAGDSLSRVMLCLVTAGLGLTFFCEMGHCSEPSAEDPTATTPASPGKAQVLHFPSDRSLGKILVQDEGTDPDLDNLRYDDLIPDYTTWTYLCEAEGTVTVPGGKRAGLALNSAAMKDLSPLSKLGPSDLYMLRYADSPKLFTPSEEQMQHLYNLSGLKVLVLHNTGLTHKELRFIGKLASLKKLNIDSTELGDAGVVHITKLRSLERLWLQGYKITDAGLRHLGKMRSLRGLHVSGVGIRGSGLIHLAKLPSLRYLMLSRNKIGDASLVYLKDAASLKKLDLDATAVAGPGLAHLSTLPELEDLDLFDTQIGDAELVYLKKLPSLKRVNLGKRGSRKARITDQGLVHLKEIKSLEHLRLPNEGFTDKGLEHLAELGKLKYLWISRSSRSPITDEGLKHLTRLQSLEELLIAGTGITDVGMSHIGKLSNLRDLRLMTMGRRSRKFITNEGLGGLCTLKRLTKLSLHGSPASISGLNHLNVLPQLKELSAALVNVEPNEPPLDIGGLTHLEKLSITVSSRSPAGIRDSDLVCLGNLKDLKWLQIGQTDITDEGMAHLAGLTAMERLGIGSPQLTDKALSHLANMGKLNHLRIVGDFSDNGLRHLEGLKALRYVSITSEDAFDPAALQRLREQLPNLGYFKAIP